MKQIRIGLTILFCLLLLFGCTSVKLASNQELLDVYNTYYKTILETDNKSDHSQYFDCTVTVSEDTVGQYRYDIVIKNARVAMYDIKVLVVKDEGGSKLVADEIMPNIGIISESNYKLIPGQYDENNGIVDQLTLSFTSNQSSLKLGIMVDYLNSSKTSRVREYLGITGKCVSEILGN